MRSTVLVFPTGYLNFSFNPGKLKPPDVVY